jgi:hypothetical protein
MRVKGREISYALRSRMRAKQSITLHPTSRNPSAARGRRLDRYLYMCQRRSHLSSLRSPLSLPPPRHAPPVCWRMPRTIGTPNASSKQTEAWREWTHKPARTRTWQCVDRQAPGDLSSWSSYNAKIYVEIMAVGSPDRGDITACPRQSVKTQKMVGD